MAVVLAAVPAGAAPAGASSGQVLFRISDSRITEASGLAVGLASPGVVYVENDSGDVNRFFAVDARTGATAATVTVPRATNVDWEDLAVAPDAAGTPSVWLADIGDNGAKRNEIQVYRVNEPRIVADGTDRVLRSSAPAVWRLRYPTGPADAESLAVAPDGTGYIITKSYLGASVVYRLPAHPDAGRVQTLTRVGAITFVPTGTPGRLGVAGQVTATSAAISPDGSLLAVRTYTEAYLWPLHDADVAAAVRAAPTRIALPAEPQGEGVAFEGGHLLFDSEGRHQAVYAVPLPARPASTTAPTSSSPDSIGHPPTPAATTATAGPSGRGASSAVWIGIGIGVGAFVVIALAVLVRVRRRPRT